MEAPLYVLQRMPSRNQCWPGPKNIQRAATYKSCLPGIHVIYFKNYKQNIYWISDRKTPHTPFTADSQTYYKNILSNFIDRRFLSTEQCFSSRFISSDQLSSYFLNVDEVYLGPEVLSILDSENITVADVREIKQTCRSYYIELCKQICTRIDFEDSTLVAIQALNPKKLGESLWPLIRLFPNLVSVYSIQYVSYRMKTCNWINCFTKWTKYYTK